MLRDFTRRALVVAMIFLPVPAIGTILHELGHFVAALAAGRAPILHYGSTGYGPPSDPQSQEEDDQENQADEYLLMTLGGPLCNIGIGTIGIIVLARRRRGRYEADIDRGDWTATVAALFWSREVFIMVFTFPALFSGRPPISDELKIEYYLSLPFLSVPHLLGVLGAEVCLAVVFLLPRRDRWPVVAGGLVGCVAGFLLWYKALGPLLLP